MKSLALLLVCATARLSASPGDTSAVHPRGSLTVLTGADTAWVFVDSVRLGTTPLTADSLLPGPHLLRLVHVDIGSWLTGSIAETVVVSAGERRTLRYAFDRRILIITNPSSAAVYVGDSLAGTTPRLLRLPPGGGLTSVRVEKRGYEEMTVPLPAGSGDIVQVTLKRIWQSEPADSSLMTESGGERSSLRLYIAGGATLVSGIAAAYFKIRADEKNAQFMETGDPSFRDQTRSLDAAAGVSLIATQIGFAFLSYFLLAD